MIINVLDKNLIEKIAAGEVVERPASIVKELVENSLDAKSTSVVIEIIDGGKKLIRVSDNGIGMDETDAKLCFTQHATSKIQNDVDLFNISTLGFRGEALSSIASVSKVTLYTRQKDCDCAFMLKNHGGQILEFEKCGKPFGTTFVVEDVFFNIPARLNFLKKTSTEASYISNIILKYILARPDIAFKFISNGKVIYNSYGDNNLKNAIFSVYGSSVSDYLLKVDFIYDYMHIYGFIGMPIIARVTKSQQNLFVNKRYIKSESISNAIKQGYQNRIMPVKNPVYILNIDMPYDKLDVNVHPNKLDVRFIDSDLVLEAFYKAIKEAFVFKEKNVRPKEILQENNLKTSNSDQTANAFKESNNKMPQKIDVINVIDKINKEASNVIIPIKKSDTLAQSAIGLHKNNDNIISEYNKPKESKKIETIKKVEVISKHSIIDEKINTKNETNQLMFESVEEILKYKIIGQLFNTYILIEYENRFVIIDQHAAHERYNTDVLLNQIENGQIVKQQLMTPITISFDYNDFSFIEENVDVINKLGFEVDIFGQNSIRINSVPYIFGQENINEFFMDTLDYLKQNKNAKIETRKEKIFQTACKHSVKAGAVLSNEEILHILKLTIENNTPMNCPHGRPVSVIYDKKDIEKWFLRIV